LFYYPVGREATFRLKQARVINTDCKGIMTEGSYHAEEELPVVVAKADTGDLGLLSDVNKKVESTTDPAAPHKQ
jgi:hypothetical protein